MGGVGSKAPTGGVPPVMAWRLPTTPERDGYTLVPTALYWKGNKVKAELALARGKQSHDKRQASKDRDWARDKQRLMRAHNKNA